MHVAYIHQYFSTKAGATGTRSYEMGQALLAAGHKVSMVCGVSDATDKCFDITGRVSENDIDGLRVLCIAENYSNSMSFVRRSLAFFRFAAEATRVVCDLKPDLVFASSTPLTVGIPGKRVRKRLGIPFVFEVRDLWPELLIAMGAIRDPFRKGYLTWLERSIYRAADHVVALAPGIRDGVCRTGYPAERVTLIPNGCDLDLFKPDDAPLADSKFGAPDDFRLVFTGAHGRANGLDAVLDGAAELKRRGVKGVRLVFIGDGMLRPHLVARAEREGLQHLTTFIQRMPKAELATVVPRMDAGLMILLNVPAFYYGTSPNKFFDYISAGIPVLNNYPGWVADMIDEHRIGRVVAPDDPRAFADGVLWLRERRAELPEMGRRARALAASEFSREVLGRRFVETLERVFDQSRGRAAAPHGVA